MCFLYMWTDDGIEELKRCCIILFYFFKRIMLKIVTLSQMMVHYFAVVINFTSVVKMYEARVNFVSFEMVLSLKTVCVLCSFYFIFFVVECSMKVLLFTE